MWRCMALVEQLAQVAQVGQMAQVVQVAQLAQVVQLVQNVQVAQWRRRSWGSWRRWRKWRRQKTGRSGRAFGPHCYVGDFFALWLVSRNQGPGNLGACWHAEALFFNRCDLQHLQKLIYEVGSVRTRDLNCSRRT